MIKLVPALYMSSRVGLSPDAALSHQDALPAAILLPTSKRWQGGLKNEQHRMKKHEAQTFRSSCQLTFLKSKGSRVSEVYATGCRSSHVTSHQQADSRLPKLPCEGPSMSLSQGFQDVVDDFCTLLRRRQLQGSLASAKKTAELMRSLITTQRHADAQAFVDDVRSVGTRVQAAKPLGTSCAQSPGRLPLSVTLSVAARAELAVGNIVRRTLHMIREEAQQVAATELPLLSVTDYREWAR